MSKNAAVYRANPLLKRVGVQIEFTQEQIEEYIKCSQSPIYFIENYVKIINIDIGEMLFKLRDYQKELIEAIHTHRRVVGRIGRQSGKSQTTIAYILWATLFNENYSVAILANKGSLAKELIDRYQKSYASLPHWLQQGVVVFNKTSVELENGSKIIAAATSSSAIRGNSCSHVILDEYAHISNNIAEEFFTSVYPVISSGENSKITVISTSKGMNHYYKLFTDAIAKRNDYFPIDIPWTRIPGRDAKFKEDFIRNTSLTQWMQEIECAFLGSSNTLVSGEKLACLAYHEPINSFSEMKIFEEPIKEGYDDDGNPIGKDHIYTITVDVSEGKNLDFSAFSVFDCSVMPYRQVAVYRSNSIPPMLFPTVLKACGEYYNNAYMLIEVNNNPSVAVDLIEDLEYENVFKVYAGNQQSQSLTPYGSARAGSTRPGLNMSPLVKRVGCSTLKTLIENDKLVINDFTTISELTTFVQSRNSFHADDGANDDMVMTLIIFSWLTCQNRFKEMVERDIRLMLQKERFNIIEEETLPIAKLSKGTDKQYFIADGAVWIEAKHQSEYDAFISDYFN